MADSSSRGIKSPFAPSSIFVSIAISITSSRKSSNSKSNSESKSGSKKPSVRSTFGFSGSRVIVPLVPKSLSVEMMPVVGGRLSLRIKTSPPPNNVASCNLILRIDGYISTCAYWG